MLSLDNAHRLLSRRRPWPNNGLWLQQLGRLEKQIDNLALTIHSRGGERVEAGSRSGWDCLRSLAACMFPYSHGGYSCG